MSYGQTAYEAYCAKTGWKSLISGAASVAVLAAAWLLITSAVGAAAPQAVVVDASRLAVGRHYYAVDVTADGTVTMTPLAVLTLGTAPVPPPGPPPNPPPPGPTPIVPDDQFGNVGQRAAAWGGELFTGPLKAHAADLGRVYAGASAALESGDLVSINAWSEKIKGEVTAILKLLAQADRDAWGAWTGRVAEVWDQQPMDRPKVVAFGKAIAAGLGAVK